MEFEGITYEKEDIKNIANNQKIICWLFLFMILGIVIPIFLIANLVAIFYVYYLARSLKLVRPWAYVIGAFIPLVSLVVLWSLISRSTKILQANNIGVGLMGYKKAELMTFMDIAE